MSVHYISAAWKVSGLPIPSKLVLLKLADNANDDGIAWPSLTTISRETGMNRTTVCRHLASLEEAGFLIQTMRGGPSGWAANQYQLVLDKWLQTATSCGGKLVAPSNKVVAVCTQSSCSRQHQPSRNRQEPSSCAEQLTLLNATAEPTPSKPIPPYLRIAWSPENGFSGIEEQDIAAFRAAYPACDVNRQIAAAGLWLSANPKKRKKNVFRFLTGWLSKSQDHGGDIPSNRPQQPRDITHIRARA